MGEVLVAENNRTSNVRKKEKKAPGYSREDWNRQKKKKKLN